MFAAALPLALPCTPAHAADEAMLEFTVIRRDTLIHLSRSLLVSPGAWREVARINKLPDPNLILPGQVLRIPARLMRSVPVPATLVAVTGDVKVGSRPAAPNTPLVQGDSLQTGPNGSAVIELADRSRVQVAPSSLAELAATRRVGARDAAPPNGAASTDGSSGWFTGSLRLLRGSAEVFATEVLRVKPLEVVTPTAVIGVRGTRYRVGFDEDSNRSTHSEVLEGKVRFDRADGASGAELPAGFGAQADAGAGVPVATKMLAAPDLCGVPQRFERPLVRLRIPEANGPTRVQIAADPGFDRMVSDQRAEAGAEVRVADLADGNWNLRVRRIGERGIEGRDATLAFVLKARPEPPAYSAPRSDAKQPVGSIAFAWARNADAPNARLQIAQDAEFGKPLLDQDDLADGRARTTIAEPGTYWWRLASIRPDGDHGPFGDPQRFELRALPTPPTGSVAPDGGSLLFKWSGRPGDRQRVELARDPQFADIVASDELESPEWQPALPAFGGRYYFRYRSVESDGYISPYSETLMIDAPRSGGWLLLLPMLPLLPLLL